MPTYQACLQLYTRLMCQLTMPTYQAITNRVNDQNDCLHEPLAASSIWPASGHPTLIDELSIEIPRVRMAALLETEQWLTPEMKICTGTTNQDRRDTHEGALRAHLLNHKVDHSDSVPIYTDGSRTERGVGWAAVFPAVTISGALPRYASVFTADLTAFNSALQHIVEQPELNFTIYSDSCNPLQAIWNIYSSTTCTDHPPLSLQTRLRARPESDLLLGPSTCWGARKRTG